jgi:hypothetical protein
MVNFLRYLGDGLRSIVDTAQSLDLIGSGHGTHTDTAKVDLRQAAFLLNGPTVTQPAPRCRREQSHGPELRTSERRRRRYGSGQHLEPAASTSATSPHTALVSAVRAADRSRQFARVPPAPFTTTTGVERVEPRTSAIGSAVSHHADSRGRHCEMKHHAPAKGRPPSGREPSEEVVGIICYF